ncbi:MAG TPA: hypothetical protein DEA08_21125 [Planctomycetes bacterium]|nr:hypothetical protein [Planctomycetota bacterium]
MERIGRFEVLGSLGRGAAGAVYRVRIPETGAEAALKLLNDPSERQRTRFEREVRALAKVSHPHVVRLLEAGQQGARPFLVLEARASGQGRGGRAGASAGEPLGRGRGAAGWLGPAGPAPRPLRGQGSARALGRVVRAQPALDSPRAPRALRARREGVA